MGSEEVLERCEVSGLCGVGEGVDEPLLLAGAGLPARFARETQAGAGLQEHAHRELERLALLRAERGIGLEVDRFGMPRVDPGGLSAPAPLPS
jgi:hypothetical protein